MAEFIVTSKDKIIMNVLKSINGKNFKVFDFAFSKMSEEDARKCAAYRYGSLR